MKIRFRIIVLIAAIAISNATIGQNDSIPKPQKQKNEKAVKGLKLLPLPVIGYNIDIGFQYGIILNLFNYGDGSEYPDYRYSIYTELSRTTKGSGVNQLFFDSKYLIPGNIRITADMSYLTELTLNFYGFNGYEAVYIPGFTDDASEIYKSRVFYNQDRRFFRFTTDLQGHTGITNLKWLGGIGYFNFDMGPVDINKLNKGKSEDKKLPDTTLLFDKYRDWGIISDSEAEGGAIPSIKAGLIYDTRDNEPNPMKGIWTEALLFYVPKIAGNKEFTYAKLAITHRQYFTLIPRNLNIMYRLGYQGTLGGKVPYFMQPYMITSFAKVTTTDGLGGAKSLRGVLRNRVVGDAVAFANFEARYKILRATLFGFNFYLGANLFADAGRVVKKIDLPPDLKNRFGQGELFSNYFDPGSEEIHWSGGGGLQLVFDQNTVLNFEYGRAFDKRDGEGSIYVGIGYLF